MVIFKTTKGECNMKKMVKMITLLTILLMVTTVYAGDLSLKPYGFLKGDMVYALKGVTSFGANTIAASQFATGGDNAALGFTAQHSRFGLKGTVGKEVKVGGRVELDFFVNAFDANAKPRMRLAYITMAKGNMEVRFGQQWDLYSPNNPSTNNTNANMWFAGNVGFRRAQIQLRYKLPMGDMNPVLQLSIGEGAKESSGLGDDNKAVFPMIQGRLCSNVMGKGIVGVYFLLAKFDPDPDADDDEVTTSGFGADFNLPFSPLLTVKGEFNTGTNLKNGNIFCLAGAGSNAYDRKSIDFWFNAISKPSPIMNLVAGFGTSIDQSDDLMAGLIEQNTVFYGDVIFPFEHGFSIALEVQNISTKIKDGDTESALVFNISGKVVF